MLFVMMIMVLLLLLVSAPSLGVYYFQQMSVCLSVYHTEFKLLLLFLFLDGIEPYFGHQFSMTPSTNSRSSIFDLSPLTPKIYSPILVAITLHFSGHIFVTS